MTKEEFFCPDCGQVHSEPGTCPICGQPMTSIEEVGAENPRKLSRNDFISAEDLSEAESENSHALEDQFI